VTVSPNRSRSGVLTIPCGQYQHRHRALGLDPPADLEPVEAGQHEVQDHQIRSMAAEGTTAAGPSAAT
jgi:hypothetical protein